MAQFKDISNKKFGRLVALSLVGRDKFKIALWECSCDCGNKCTVRLTSLSSGATRSCGCLNSESRVSSGTGNTKARTHGLSKHPLYSTWSTMKQRCCNPLNSKYYLYGARGIKVCPEWVDSFETFLNDMGDRPEGSTLNRIDNDGNYEKSNCEWSTVSDQNANRRKYKRRCRAVQ